MATGINSWDSLSNHCRFKLTDWYEGNFRTEEKEKLRYNSFTRKYKADMKISISGTLKQVVTKKKVSFYISNSVLSRIFEIEIINIIK